MLTALARLHLSWLALLIGLAWMVAEPAAAEDARPTANAPESCVATPGVPAARLALLRRGFNLTGWLDGSPPRAPDMAVLAALRAKGFTHIRLPVTAERVIEAFAEPIDTMRTLADLDRAIAILLGRGFAVSIDLHPGDRLGRLYRTDPAKAFGSIDAAWRKLATRYAREPADRLFFEVLNEPTADQAIWNADGPRLAATIRRAAPNHTIVYGPANFQRIEALEELAPLPDLNVVYAFHYYDPMVFTHQGLDWSQTDPLRYLEGVPFPASLADPRVSALAAKLAAAGHVDAATQLERDLETPWNEERIASAFAGLKPWLEAHHRPVILNEFGVLRWKASPADRARWLATVRRAAERLCVGWAHWDYADAFGLAQRRGNGREVLDPATIEALVGSRP